MDYGDTLEAYIDNEQHVVTAIAAMTDPRSKYKEIRFRKEAAKQVGDRGNQAVCNHLARALENCKIPNVHIIFRYCNLSANSVQLLANALEKSTTVGAFTCEQNPFNFPNGEDYDPKTDEMVKRAIINTKAPITKWNRKPLSEDVVEARRLLTAAPPPTVVALDNIPSVEELAAVDKSLSEARMRLSQEQAKLDADAMERDELSARIGQRDRELKTMKDKLAILDDRITQEKRAVEQARAVIAESEKFQKDVEELRMRLGYWSTIQSLPIAAVAEDPNLCQICMERSKNRTFYKCGHQVCALCADTIMDGTNMCPFCNQPILDVITNY